MGVPVTIAGSDVIIGFDRVRLERLAQSVAPRSPSRSRLGVTARDATGGVEIGRVNPNEPAERARLQSGDVIEAINGVSLGSVSALTHALDQLADNRPYEIQFRRGPQRLRAIVHW